MANVPDKGDLSNGSFDPSVVRGDTSGFGSGTSNPGVGAPVFLDGNSVDQNAVNAKGAVGGTDSDSMFEKFYRGQLDHVTGSESAASVPSSSLVDGGAKSDPEGQELANEQALGAGALSSKADKD
jgi:hypothetical protein